MKIYLISNTYSIALRACLVSIVCLMMAAFSSAQQSEGIKADSTQKEFILRAESNVKVKVSTYLSDGISGDEINLPTASFSNMLYGRIPGLTVSQNSGTPGDDAASLNIRGIATYYNSTIPVFIDGFQVNKNLFESLSAFEVEKVEVLKDAASLAAFGMRGANGIIRITTKRGIDGKPKVRFQSRMGYQQASLINKPLGTEQYAHLYNEAISNDKNAWTPLYSADGIKSLPNVDWYEEVLKESTPYYDANVSVQGGNRVAKYYVMLGNVSQKGLYDLPINDTLANASLNRYNVRANLDVNLFSFLEAKIDIGGYVTTGTRPNTNISNLWDDMAKYPGLIYPVKNQINNEWTGTTVYPHNPLAETRAQGRTSSHERSIQFNLALKEKLDGLIQGLYLKQSMSLSSWVQDTAYNSRNYARYINTIQQTTDQNTPYNRFENSGNAQWDWKQFGATAGYDIQFGAHKISASVNGLYNVYNTDKSLNGKAGMMLNYKYANINGVINYSYNTKYEAEVSVAASGSDNYKPGNQWGYYPTLSAAWIISNEDFVKHNSSIDFLKLQASVGQTGYDPMFEQRFLWQNYYSTQGGFNSGNGNPTWNSGLGMMYMANASIFAEKSTKYDIGVNARLFKKINLEINGFVDKRSEIVTLDNMVPSTMGVNSPYNNVGKVTNKGYELKLTYLDRIFDFNYFATAILSYSHNTIDYMAEVVTVNSAARTGNSIGSIYGYQADGFYDVSDFDVTGKLKSTLSVPTFGEVKPGDVKYKDILIDGVIDENDQTKIGNSYLPEYTYSFQLGFNWKGFDASALLQGVLGRDVNLMDAPLQTIAFRNNGNLYPIAEGRWTYYPEQGIDTRATATYPRLTTENSNNNNRNSTLWVRNGDFLKLRNVEVGYTLSSVLFKKMGIEKCRFFITGINLMEFSKLRTDLNMDAEVLSGYPPMKSFNGGFTLNF